MGQYYLVVNTDKGEYLHAHRFDDGLKLMEFGASGSGTMMGLAILLADGNGRGGGDLHSDDALIGSWAGDHIVITGDYADEGKFIPEDAEFPITDEYGDEYTLVNTNLYTYAGIKYEDISEKVITVLRDAGEHVAGGESLRPDFVISV